MPTQQMRAWIENYKKNNNGRSPTPGMIQQAQERIYRNAAAERQRSKTFQDSREKLKRTPKPKPKPKKKPKKKTDK